MALIENKDYRLNHDLRILYMSKRLYDASYRLNTEACMLTWRWKQKGYSIIHNCSDHFIETGEEKNSLF